MIITKKFLNDRTRHSGKIANDNSNRVQGVRYRSAVTMRFLVDDLVVVELKSVEKILTIPEAQVITCMKLLKVPKGIMINLNVTNIFKEGQNTFVNELFRHLPE